MRLIQMILKFLLLRHKNARIFHFEGKSVNSVNEFVIFCSDNNIASKNTELFDMIVGVLTTCHTQYTSDRIICIFFI